MPFVYILQCSDGSLYTGSTYNLNKRIWDHQQGLGGQYTKSRLPVKLVYAEEYYRIDEAYIRERQIHGWSRRKKFALIDNRESDLPSLSKSKRDNK